MNNKTYTNYDALRQEVREVWESCRGEKILSQTKGQVGQITSEIRALQLETIKAEALIDIAESLSKLLLERKRDD